MPHTVTNVLPHMADMAKSVGTPQMLSFWNLFLQADWVIKSVIVILVVASIFSWALTVFRYRALKQANNDADYVMSSFNDVDMEKIYNPQGGVFIKMLSISAKEKERFNASNTPEQKELSLQRMEHLFMIAIEQEREELSAHVSMLAAIGSNAPFLGLFGTVWGIMNSFQAIAMSNNNSLAVVAPGIAEALFVTAIGLAVAIPASIGYNRIASSLQSYTVRMETFAQRLMAHSQRMASL